MLSDSLWLSFLLYAADPTPLSAVCRKKVGSLDPRDFAIWLLDIASSVSGFGISAGPDEAGDPRNGRGRVEFESLDNGLCCQERVPLLAREVAVGGVGMDALELFCGGVGNALPPEGSDNSFGKRGDWVASILGDRVGVCVCEGGVKSTGGSMGRLVVALVSVVADELGAGEDFDGDMDRARSGRVRLVSPIPNLHVFPGPECK